MGAACSCNLKTMLRYRDGYNDSIFTQENVYVVSVADFLWDASNSDISVTSLLFFLTVICLHNENQCNCSILKRIFIKSSC